MPLAGGQRRALLPTKLRAGGAWHRRRAAHATPTNNHSAAGAGVWMELAGKINSTRCKKYQCMPAANYKQHAAASAWWTTRARKFLRRKRLMVTTDHHDVHHHNNAHAPAPLNRNRTAPVPCRWRATHPCASRNQQHALRTQGAGVIIPPT